MIKEGPEIVETVTTKNIEVFCDVCNNSCGRWAHRKCEVCGRDLCYDCSKKSWGHYNELFREMYYWNDRESGYCVCKICRKVIGSDLYKLEQSVYRWREILKERVDKLKHKSLTTKTEKEE